MTPGNLIATPAPLREVVEYRLRAEGWRPCDSVMVNPWFDNKTGGHLPGGLLRAWRRDTDLIVTLQLNDDGRGMLVFVPLPNESAFLNWLVP